LFLFFLHYHTLDPEIQFSQCCTTILSCIPDTQFETNLPLLLWAIAEVAQLSTPTQFWTKIKTEEKKNTLNINNK
jgi:hypothetical protein